MKEKIESFWHKKVESLAELKLGKFDPGFQVIGEYLSQIDSIQIWESVWIDSQIWLQYSPITRYPRSNFSSGNDSTFQVKMTPFSFSDCVDKSIWKKIPASLQRMTNVG